MLFSQIILYINIYIHKYVNKYKEIHFKELIVGAGKSKNSQDRGFPYGAVVKNPPANAGDMGSSPGPGRSHMPQSN